MNNIKVNAARAVIYEVIAITLLNGALFLMGKPVLTSFLFTLGTTTIATVWNFVYNYGYDRMNLPRFGAVNRLWHTTGYQIVLISAITVFYSFMYQAPIIEGFLFNLPLSIFFFVYTFVFNKVFDDALAHIQKRKTDKKPAHSDNALGGSESVKSKDSALTPGITSLTS